jgi:hypothetical protein
VAWLAVAIGRGRLGRGARRIAVRASAERGSIATVVPAEGGEELRSTTGMPSHRVSTLRSTRGPSPWHAVNRGDWRSRALGASETRVSALTHYGTALPRRMSGKLTFARLPAVSIRRERRRLDRAFRAALFAVGSPAIMIACSSSGSSPSDAGKESGPSSAIDATLDSLVPDASDASEAQVDADASSSPILDSGHVDVAKPAADSGGNNNGGCFEGSYGIEAGPDSDVCAYIYACGLEGSGLASSGCQVLEVGGDDELVPVPGTTCWIPEDAGCNDDAIAPYNEAGGVIVYCNPCPTSGRRPAGLREPRPRDGSGVGAYLARMAFEEEASIVAFERMQRELRALGAPKALRSAARRAARDEVRHARTMRRLARARGGRVERACVADVPDRRAAAVALENAIEGCVRETYGALVATWQSHRARDSEVRRAFARIAEDETSHAALSWAVARWIEARLCAGDRERVARARLAAIKSLRTSVAIDPPAELVGALGLPTARDAGALLDAMGHELA